MTENEKITAICVRSIDYKENDKLLTLCSAERGKVTAVARGAKKATAKLKFCTQPFNFGEYTLIGKGNYIIDCNQIESFSSITSYIDSYYCGFTVLEILMKSCAEDVPAPRLVVSAAKTLASLCEDNNKPRALIGQFMLSVLSESGYNFDFTTCAVCKAKLDSEAYFLPAEGVVCEHCSGAFQKKIPSEVLKTLANGDDATEIMHKNANMFLSEIVLDLIGIKINSLGFDGEL